MAMCFRFHSSNWGRSGNYTRFKDLKVDKLLEEARKELDAEKRKAVYKKAAKLMIDGAPWLFFRQAMMFRGKSEKLERVVFHPS